MLQSKPDSSYGLPLETGCPSCPALLQLSLFLFLKAQTHKIKEKHQHKEALKQKTEAYNVKILYCHFKTDFTALYIFFIILKIAYTLMLYVTRLEYALEMYVHFYFVSKWLPTRAHTILCCICTCAVLTSAYALILTYSQYWVTHCINMTCIASVWTNTFLASMHCFVSPLPSFRS